MAKKPFTEFGADVPLTLKFGLVVMLAVLWVDFIRFMLRNFFLQFFDKGSGAAEFILAAAATVAVFLFFVTYRRITYALRKIKIGG